VRWRGSASLFSKGSNLAPGPHLQPVLPLPAVHIWLLHLLPPCCAGNRAYADSVCRLLDPDGAFFGDRIIAQVRQAGFGAACLQGCLPAGCGAGLLALGLTGAEPDLLGPLLPMGCC